MIKNFINKDEKELLTEFSNFINTIQQKNKLFKFCGHNIDAFDLPFILKRMIINGVKIPNKLILHKYKPWEYPTVDTMKIWKFGSFEWTSLDTICTVMGITSPKTEEVNNKIISEIYHSDDPDALTKIYKYCNNDVNAVINLMIKFSML